MVTRSNELPGMSLKLSTSGYQMIRLQVPHPVWQKQKKKHIVHSCHCPQTRYYIRNFVPFCGRQYYTDVLNLALVSAIESPRTDGVTSWCTVHTDCYKRCSSLYISQGVSAGDFVTKCSNLENRHWMLVVGLCKICKRIHLTSINISPTCLIWPPIIIYEASEEGGLLPINYQHKITRGCCHHLCHLFSKITQVWHLILAQCLFGYLATTTVKFTSVNMAHTDPC